MTQAPDEAQQAYLAIRAALIQLAAPVKGALDRLDSDARSGYLDLHTQIAGITQRLADELTPQLDQLTYTHSVITAGIGAYEQQRIDELHAAVTAPAARIAGAVVYGAQTLGRRARR